MNILGINGSPRIGGNTDTLLDRTLEGARSEGANVEKVVLSNLTFSPCQECENLKDDGSCIIEDDMQLLYKKIEEADAVILASPVYFSSATPQMKALIDRAGYLSGAKGRVFENKVGGAIAVARRAGQNFTFAQLLFFFLHQGMIVPGSTYWNVAFGRNRGDVDMDEEGLRTAWNLGKKMVWLINKIKGEY